MRITVTDTTPPRTLLPCVTDSEFRLSSSDDAEENHQNKHQEVLETELNDDIKKRDMNNKDENRNLGKLSVGRFSSLKLVTTRQHKERRYSDLHQMEQVLLLYPLAGLNPFF